MLALWFDLGEQSMSKNPAQQLIEFGQSVWYDNISRELLVSGKLKQLFNDWGIRGITSNPSIFDNAIRNSSTYDADIAKLKVKTDSADEIFQELAVSDIAQAADLLLPIYNQSEGVDGFASIEVSPLLARDAKKTVEEAKLLYSKLNRPNIMIKIPATPECIPAIEECLAEGISVNVTLIFSVQNYIEVANAYCRALSKRAEKNLPVDKIRSVASFFVSRVDGVFDKKVEASLQGKFGIANSKIAYSKFKEIFSSSEFKKLEAKGAKAQRPLWASTSTKNPAYRDVLYVEELIGQDTVNTVPHSTLEAFVDHGKPRSSLNEDLDQALSLEQKIKSAGIDIEAELLALQIDGVKKFEESYHQLIAAIKAKL